MGFWGRFLPVFRWVYPENLVGFLVSAQVSQLWSVVSSSGPWFQHCCPSVWNSLASSIHTCDHHTHSVVFSKPVISSRPSVPPSSSHKCLKFSQWLTQPTIKDVIHLPYLHQHQNHQSSALSATSSSSLQQPSRWWHVFHVLEENKHKERP